METRVARRYANALFNASRKVDADSRVGQELGELVQLARTNKETAGLLLSPLIPRDVKNQSIQKALPDIHPLTSKLLSLLFEKRREDNLGLIWEEFERLRENASGIIRAEVSCSRKLDEDQRSALISVLENQTGKRVLINETVDGTLLGGIMVQIGDLVLDGSVKGDLRRMRERFIMELARLV